MVTVVMLFKFIFPTWNNKCCSSPRTFVSPNHHYPSPFLLPKALLPPRPPFTSRISPFLQIMLCTTATNVSVRCHPAAFSRRNSAGSILSHDRLRADDFFSLALEKTLARDALSNVRRESSVLFLYGYLVCNLCVKPRDRNRGCACSTCQPPNLEHLSCPHLPSTKRRRYRCCCRCG